MKEKNFENLNIEGNEFFGRINENGDVAVLYASDGSPVTRMDAALYPAGSDGSKSTRYEWPDGIVLTRQDAESIGLEIEE